MLLVVLIGSPFLVVGSDVEIKIAGNSVPISGQKYNHACTL